MGSGGVGAGRDNHPFCYFIGGSCSSIVVLIASLSFTSLESTLIRLRTLTGRHAVLTGKTVFPFLVFVKV